MARPHLPRLEVQRRDQRCAQRRAAERPEVKLVPERRSGDTVLIGQGCRGKRTDAEFGSDEICPPHITECPDRPPVRPGRSSPPCCDVVLETGECTERMVRDDFRGGAPATVPSPAPTAPTARGRTSTTTTSTPTPRLPS